MPPLAARLQMLLERGGHLLAARCGARLITLAGRVGELAVELGRLIALLCLHPLDQLLHPRRSDEPADFADCCSRLRDQR